VEHVSEEDMSTVCKVPKVLSLNLQSPQVNAAKTPTLTVLKLPVHHGTAHQATVAQIML
jgi:hypothetical protein